MCTVSYPSILKLQQDFAKIYTPRPDGEIMSEGFIIGESLGMEGVFVNYQPSSSKNNMYSSYSTYEQHQDGDVV